MDNKILLQKLLELPEIRINKHNKNELYNAECITRKPHHYRKNVVGNIRPTGRSFILYSNGDWISKNELGIKTIDEAMEWIKKDIEFLSR